MKISSNVNFGTGLPGTRERAAELHQLLWPLVHEPDPHGPLHVAQASAYDVGRLIAALRERAYACDYEGDHLLFVRGHEQLRLVRICENKCALIVDVV